MTLRVYIGWDGRESVAWHVLTHSIITRARRPVSITPIILPQVRHVFNRKRDPMQSTDFAYSRFLTPYLAGDGVSVFMDCDMLCLTDICELEDLAMSSDNLYHDVLVVKHDYTPVSAIKFLHQPQLPYPCKNWSSLMVFNGHRSSVRRLTPERVSTMSGMELHQFKWANSVGEIPVEWNHLVGEYKPNPHAKIVHYTLGSPCFSGFENCEFAQEWFDELGMMTHCEDPTRRRASSGLSSRPARTGKASA